MGQRIYLRAIYHMWQEGVGCSSRLGFSFEGSGRLFSSVDNSSDTHHPMRWLRPATSFASEKKGGMPEDDRLDGRYDQVAFLECRKQR